MELSNVQGGESRPDPKATGTAVMISALACLCRGGVLCLPCPAVVKQQPKCWQTSNTTRLHYVILYFVRQWGCWVEMHVMCVMVMEC